MTGPATRMDGFESVEQIRALGSDAGSSVFTVLDLAVLLINSRAMQWYEDEDFWREMYNHMFNAEKFREAEEQVSEIISLTAFEEGPILDLCCGPGRHAIGFARRGYRVTGVDRTKFLLDLAKERATESGQQIEWIQRDMREFVRPNAFGLVVNLWTSFGYFENDADDLRILSNVFESLRPGGVFLIDLLGKEIIARGFSLTTSTEHQDGSLLVERHKICDGWNRVANEWILIKEGRARRSSTNVAANFPCRTDEVFGHTA
jgi:SAM-dependent methyltransferase